LRGGDLIVAFPTFWQAVAVSCPHWRPGVRGVSSGAPCPPPTGAALRALGLSDFTDIYGSTETGGIGWRSGGSDAFELFPHWRKIGHDRLVKNYGLGDCGYELPDVVEWESGRRLTPIRRRDGAVQVGGVNVYPETVRAVLKSHPGVADAAVRLMRPHEGERLKAFIVPRDPHAAPENLRAELEDWIAHRLTAPRRPRAFSFGPALPANARGKPCDWPLNAPAGLREPT
jgi:4-coumarate--CoA ligase (photoactive yellow protein activation family)